MIDQLNDGFPLVKFCRTASKSNRNNPEPVILTAKIPKTDGLIFFIKKTINITSKLKYKTTGKAILVNHDSKFTSLSKANKNVSKSIVSNKIIRNVFLFNLSNIVKESQIKQIDNSGIFNQFIFEP